MKKIIFTVLLVVFVLSGAFVLVSNFAFKKSLAFDTSKYDKVEKLGSDTVKVKKGEKWGILSSDGEELLPVKYEKIRRIYYKNINGKEFEILHGKDGNSWVAINPPRVKQKFFEAIYNSSNKNTWLHYNSYPITGIFPFKIGPKYGIVIIQEDEARVLDPQFDDVYFQDSKSAIYQQFNFSFSNPDTIIVKKGKKWGVINRKGEWITKPQYDTVIMANARVKEVVQIKNNTISFDFKGIEFPVQDKLVAIEGNVIKLVDKQGNVFAEAPTISNEIQFKDFQAKDFLSQVYKENNEKASFVKYENYPTEGIFKYREGKDYGLVIAKNGGNKIIPAEYQDFKFQDSNSAIFAQLNISFSNPERIVAKKGDKWGIIDEDNNVVVDFQYNDVIMLEAIAYEVIETSKNGVVFKYESIVFPGSTLLLVQKDTNFGVIDKDGKEIIPLQFPFIKVPEKAQKQADVKSGGLSQMVKTILHFLP